MDHKKRVLVTGANGFVGRETVKRLRIGGWTVIPAMRSPVGEGAIKLDLEDAAFSETLKRLPKIDAIVHLATMVGFGDLSLGDIFAANVAATASLLLLAKQWDAVFVFASAALVSGINTTQIDADTPDRPDTAYMKSKWLAEQLIQASGVRYSILRIGGVFGLDGPTHLGLNRAIKCVSSGQPPAMIGRGSAKRNYIYVKDVAGIISCVLDHNIEGTHLVAGNEVHSVADMLQILCDVFLPGQSPERHEGLEAMDQIIIPSKEFALSGSFRDSVINMYSSGDR
ncbi:NAD(P)-dependent oxidoreductase [Chlorobium sp. BLA1]|uniref:NAD-dependent epimerase/dehydratase family protein n=1 Tax=Candidatus Chlorobium masyuteum TaxID=2716876 RepID=UPI0014200B86|nr:NAD(P)-dependent oxidoreductase [Candidatus Chlorobium masyuteum]NHQ59247.1 NAD(P)-dependent oxidoreductase [Candidatus Chlorobium masyuteum]